MLIYIDDDILNTDCTFIIHGCNAQGVMGAGVAKAIKEHIPDAYKSYRKAYEKDCLVLGKAIIVHTKRYVVGNLITQKFYGRGQKYADPIAIECALRYYIEYIALWCAPYLDKLPPIASPKIGCGLGGLSWEKDVEPIYNRLSMEYKIDFMIYETNQEKWK